MCCMGLYIFPLSVCVCECLCVCARAHVSVRMCVCTSCVLVSVCGCMTKFVSNLTRLQFLIQQPRLAICPDLGSTNLVWLCPGFESGLAHLYHTQQRHLWPHITWAITWVAHMWPRYMTWHHLGHHLDNNLRHHHGHYVGHHR